MLGVFSGSPMLSLQMVDLAMLLPLKTWGNRRVV